MLIAALLSHLGEFHARTVAELGAQNGRRSVRLRSGFVVVRSVVGPVVRLFGAELGACGRMVAPRHACATQRTAQPISGARCLRLRMRPLRSSAPLVGPVRCPVVRSVAVRSVVRLPTRPHAELGARCGPFVGSLRVHATRPLVVAHAHENRGMRARPM